MDRLGYSPTDVHILLFTHFGKNLWLSKRSCKNVRKATPFFAKKFFKVPLMDAFLKKYLVI